MLLSQRAILPSLLPDTQYFLSKGLKCEDQLCKVCCRLLRRENRTNGAGNILHLMLVSGYREICVIVPLVLPGHKLFYKVCLPHWERSDVETVLATDSDANKPLANQT